MKKLVVVGLGNPGPEYQGTRHNLGHWIVGELRESEAGSSPVHLLKTNVPMNLSGEEVKKLVDNYRLPLNNLVIVHDDVDIPLGDFRLEKGRGSAGHKGVESVIKALGTKDFWRMRIGIGRPPSGVEVGDYVLSRLTKKEKTQLLGLLPNLSRGIAKMEMQS